MVTKQAENYRRTILNQGFILATTSLSVLLLLTIYIILPLDFTTLVFAQEQNTNLSSSATTSPSNTNKATISYLNSTQVDFVSNIEQIRGHINAAIMNKEAGNNSLAMAHTLHPIAEIYSSIEPQIRQLIQNKVSAEELQQHIDKINNNLDKAEELLADETIA